MFTKFVQYDQMMIKCEYKTIGLSTFDFYLIVMYLWLFFSCRPFYDLRPSLETESTLIAWVWKFFFGSCGLLSFRLDNLNLFQSKVHLCSYIICLCQSINGLLSFLTKLYSPKDDISKDLELRRHVVWKISLLYTFVHNRSCFSSFFESQFEMRFLTYLKISHISCK